MVVDGVVPRLIRVFPQSHLPTVLRSSSLSILGVCVDTDYRALLPWANDLLGAALDLLQIESVAAKPRPKQPVTEAEDEMEDGQKALEAEPTKSRDGKHPVLRRAALVFVGLLLDAVAKDVSEAKTPSASSREIHILPMSASSSSAGRSFVAIKPYLMQKTQTVLGYIRSTDMDSLVTHQAGEALSILRNLQIYQAASSAR